MKLVEEKTSLFDIVVPHNNLEQIEARFRSFFDSIADCETVLFHQTNTVERWIENGKGKLNHFMIIRGLGLRLAIK